MTATVDVDTTYIGQRVRIRKSGRLGHISQAHDFPPQGETYIEVATDDGGRVWPLLSSEVEPQL